MKTCRIIGVPQVGSGAAIYDPVYTYCISSFDSDYIPQCIVITIASTQHPVSTGQCEEAKR
jgi:hypothetical protein